MFIYKNTIWEMLVETMESTKNVWNLSTRNPFLATSPLIYFSSILLNIKTIDVLPKNLSFGDK